MKVGSGLDRLVALFVASAPGRASRTRSSGATAAAHQLAAQPEIALVRRAPCVTILCRPADAAALGTVVALVLLRASRTRAGLVAVWPETALVHRRVGSPVRPAAGRLQGALVARGLEARGAGPLVFTPLAVDPQAAVVAARRAAAAAPGPVVNVLAGPRTDVLAPVVRDADRVLVAGRADDAVVALALGGLLAEGIDARPLPVPESVALRALAASGLGVPGALRETLNEVLEGLA